MGESYVLVGQTLSLKEAVILGIMCLGLCGFTWWRTKKIEAVIPLIVLLILVFVVSLMGLPMEWALAGGFVAMSVSMLFTKVAPARRPLRWLFSAAMLGAGICYFFMSRLEGGDTLEFNAHSVTFAESGTRRTVPRVGLTVHATAGNTRRCYSWTSFSGNNLGPHVSGSGVYWGPSGLVYGDDLGRRLAKWAGTEPEYDRKPAANPN